MWRSQSKRYALQDVAFTQHSPGRHQTLRRISSVPVLSQRLDSGAGSDRLHFFHSAVRWVKKLKLSSIRTHFGHKSDRGISNFSYSGGGVGARKR
jgi:hypothetical protein